MAHSVPFGVLMIYAEQPGVFGEAEIESLTNHAEILSFGITSLRERQQTEVALSEISELNQQVVSSAHEGIIVYDRDLRCQMWNPFMEELTGLSAQEVVGSFPFEKFPLLRTLGVEASLKKALAGEANSSEDVPLTYSGKTFWVSGRHTPLRNRSGQVTGVLVTLRDVTERRRAEEALRSSEERLRQAARTSKIGIFEHNHITDTIYWSPEQRELFGVGPDEVATLSVYLDHVYAEDRAAMAAAIRRAHDPAGDGLFDVENRILSSDGSLRWITTRSQTFFEGEGAARHKVCTVGAMLDITERRQADEAVRASHAQLHGIVASAMDAIITVDGKEQIVLFNQAAEKMFGFTAKEMAGQPLDRLLPERFRQAHAQRLDAFAKTGATARHMGDLGSLSGLRAHGQEFPIEASISVVSLAGEKYLTAILRDITERERAEDALRHSEESFRLLFEQAPDGIFLADAQGRYQDVNLAGVRMLGYSLEEVRRLTIADIVAPEEIERIAPEVTRLAGGGVVSSEWRFRRKDGSFYDGEVVGRQLPDGRLVGIVRNVTDRKRAEQALREAEEKYRGIFEGAVVGIFQSDLSGRYLSANPAMARIFGYDSAQELLTNITDISWQVYVDPESRGTFRRLIEQQGVVPNYECQVYRKDGSKIWISVSARAVRKDGVLVGYEGSNIDITERKLLEAQLLQAQKMEAVGQLAGGVAHDFNNILGVILGYADLSLGLIAPDNPANRHQAQIKKAANRAVSLTRQLLAFSRRQVVFPRILDLNEVMHNVTKMLLRMVGDDIAISFQPTTPIGSINADPNQIEQVLMNLAVNARDAMPSGGKIIIGTGHAELDEHFASQNPGSRAGQYVVLTVSDTGCGMDENIRSRIFEPFFTTKGVGQGTGLGLSTVYGIVKQGGGYIWVFSQLGSGTTFKMYFPRVAQKAEELVPSHEEAEPLGGSETILVVEDDEPLRELAVRILQDAGYRVIEAKDAEAALDILQVSKPGIDLLLTDVIMPGKTGSKLVEQARVVYPNLRSLFMSGYPGDLVALRGGLMPESAFLEKPFTRSSLLRKVYSALHSESEKQQSH
jgi:PAS domain S-box-containing protein